MNSKLELATLLLSPFGQDEEVYVYRGYVLSCSYIFYVDENTLLLRHVQKVEGVEHIYIDGHSGGIILAENVTGNTQEIIKSIVKRLSGMDGL
ncbi:hypothetical protein [Paenibacillus cucumis (ex Kampfer et al. 2016)]|uniref:DUF3055 domain-containing protein n=1 Tax=Paenibacillus cucumis (ex Kampfer et al. 2016) TaxID=1776858 RepID=A0ABS7KRH9_9BACL|nr:hypothetical protein [Paenibacillus cucumis (ex Kampfer et al. 2016)]MBY0206779.1 hypothetical protein [Paenibacillus cucumis (ex Kampfer et al. 2016)]